jgi:hypothetical protein
MRMRAGLEACFGDPWATDGQRFAENGGMGTDLEVHFSCQCHSGRASMAKRRPLGRAGRGWSGYLLDVEGNETAIRRWLQPEQGNKQTCQ